MTTRPLRDVFSFTTDLHNTAIGRTIVSCFYFVRFTISQFIDDAFMIRFSIMYTLVQRRLPSADKRRGVLKTFEFPNPLIANKKLANFRVAKFPNWKISRSDLPAKSNGVSFPRISIFPRKAYRARQCTYTVFENSVVIPFMPEQRDSRQALASRKFVDVTGLNSIRYSTLQFCCTNRSRRFTDSFVHDRSSRSVRKTRTSAIDRQRSY